MSDEFPEDRVHEDIPEGKKRPWRTLYAIVVIGLFLQILLYTWFTRHFQ